MEGVWCEPCLLVVHYKDKQLVRHKKRWSQVMYLYYLLDWKVSTKYYKRWGKGGDEDELKSFRRRKTTPTSWL
ncbi:hypothetical protein PBY51_004910 [Eleginops maclovinus]|uniref:Uncharacterized protein n=1 Tax=Eleginops maclovinus TaxID=56733 RepID=A0AAN7X861_ELEMC|nr:hypothetical protein PBY51_004910 [Eleginops maclovinus]